jgi:hypothetical protein
MKIEGTLDKIHEWAIQNIWLQRFTIFMALAATYLLCWDYDKLKPIFKGREKNCSAVRRNDFVLEGLFWAILGIASHAVFAYIGIGNIHKLGYAGAVAAFTGGLLFGLYSVWHRRAAFAAA